MPDRSQPDVNLTKSLIVVSNADNTSPVTLWADPVTHGLVTSGGGSGGTQYTDGATGVTHPIGTQQVFINGSNVVTAVSTTNPLPITGSISVGGTTDEAAFTAGTSTFTSSGGVFNDSVAALTSGQQGTMRLTANRAVHFNLRNVSGTEIGTSSNPVRIDPTGTTVQGANLTQINGTAISGANPLPTTQYTTTGNGFTSSHYISAASTNATNIKASAGDIGGIQAYNNTGTIGYLKIYDKASSPTVGTDVPVKTILIPANTSGAGTNISFASPGISCSSGISFAITGGIADADTAAVAANAFVVNFDTK